LTWKVSFLAKAQKQLARLDVTARNRILKFVNERLLALPDPRSLGKPLTGEKQGLFRYRVGDYRLICELKDQVLTILVLEVGHRREIYR